MLKILRQIMAYVLVTLSQRSWYGAPKQTPKPNLGVQLTQVQKHACKRKPPTFRYRGRSK